MPARTTTRTARKTTKAAPAKTTRTRKTADPVAEMVAEFVAAIENGDLDGHLTTLDAALDGRASASTAAKRTRATTAKSASAKPAARKTATGKVAKLTLDELEQGKTYALVSGTKSAKGVDLTGQRVTFVRTAKKGGVDVAKVTLGEKTLLFPASALSVAGRGRPPKVVEL